MSSFTSFRNELLFVFYLFFKSSIFAWNVENNLSIILSLPHCLKSKGNKVNSSWAGYANKENISH